ncbi:SDR family NAD(P)-dependent oxidoreductase [Flavobacterium lindanitolerans]|uniref:3-oxoacyl-[acyl-carrier protein] reductase n=1 Tax=Flavobacterium lindanitolerans TaxID=428988 RepID=A0A497UKF8_9FLAO|nr:glucose 1-dehydrogenase [Flavobacterium lindanitolerans]MBC8644467.1 glucose 1-dehydrogenase [Flavobacterium lindanitolerans]PKW20944.1 3-oxoacyl-[acyl-carrier protein] reductase [Flavobacterium lindanitolerans]RLJ30417.1 3-oxoacyl-[acyl-carrier protein] reductase [Flavobacterium lindanitolerans]
MSKLKDKVAIVTGASKGIGASIAKYFAAEGAKVVVNYASSKEGADKVVRAITEQGGTAIAVQGDVSKEADVARIFEETRNTFGSLDILVNNAGVYLYEPIEQISAETFHKSFNINVLGSIFAIQESLKLFGDKGGNIINISSGASNSPLPTGSVYSATKTALDAITIALSKEFSGRNIRINSILPGIVETEGSHSAGFIGSEAEASFVSKTPLGRTGQPDDIAKVAVFLASDDAAWITGEKISVGGGIYGF